MKNILFYYDNYCGADSRGGTEVATFRIAHALHDHHGWNVFNAFRNKTRAPGDSLYSATIKLGKGSGKFVSALATFIKDHEIDVVVNMSRFFRHRLLEEAIGRSGRKVSLIFMQHFAPGSEWKKGSYKAGFHLLKFDPLNPLYWLRSSIYPLLKLPRRLSYPDAYRRVYEASDRIVLLSEGYKPLYKEIGRLPDTLKFSSIPNVFDSGIDEKKREAVLQGKEKRVLILSRMDEVQKRLSLSLKIWKEIEKDHELQDWHLDIVGTGHDMKGMKRMAKKLGLKKVVFHGWQVPEEFLEKSSVLMMTSEYEGLPLSLMEAMAFGCVPVAFDSFASLKDILHDGENGVIVKDFGDIVVFSEKLKTLLKNDSLRNNMARGNKSMVDFSSESVGNRWNQMLMELSAKQS